MALSTIECSEQKVEVEVGKSYFLDNDADLVIRILDEADLPEMDGPFCELTTLDTLTKIYRGQSLTVLDVRVVEGHTLLLISRRVSQDKHEEAVEFFCTKLEDLERINANLRIDRRQGPGTPCSRERRAELMDPDHSDHRWDDSVTSIKIAVLNAVMSESER